MSWNVRWMAPTHSTIFENNVRRNLRISKPMNKLNQIGQMFWIIVQLARVKFITIRSSKTWKIIIKRWSSKTGHWFLSWRAILEKCLIFNCLRLLSSIARKSWSEFVYILDIPKILVYHLALWSFSLDVFPCSPIEIPELISQNDNKPTYHYHILNCISSNMIYNLISYDHC